MGPSGPWGTKGPEGPLGGLKVPFGPLWGVLSLICRHYWKTLLALSTKIENLVQPFWLNQALPLMGMLKELEHALW